MLQCCELEKRAESLRQQGEARVSELERRLAEQQQQTDTTGEVTHTHRQTEKPETIIHPASLLSCVCVCVREQVKRVMNGVFHSLRGEFELNETYTGSAVLGVLVNTIKVSERQEQHTHIVKDSVTRLLLFKQISRSLSTSTERHPEAAFKI